MPKETDPFKVMINPPGRRISLGLSELWQYRELLYFLAWRDVKVRYKQTFLGVAWAVLNPVIQMFVWAFIFGRVANLSSNGVPYVLITLSGTLAWNFFSEIVTGSSNSMITNTNLVTKIYFPRELVPLSIVFRALIDFGITLIILGGVLVYFKVPLTPSVFLFPCFVFILILTAIGIGLFSSALSVKYRDVAKIIPYFLQICFFITPVAYLNAAIPGKFQWLYNLNPMAGVIEGVRWSLLHTPVFWPRIAFSGSIGLFLFVAAIFYFKRSEQTFADII